MLVYTPIEDGGGVVWGGGNGNGIVFTGNGTVAMMITNIYHGQTTLSNMGVIVLGAPETPMTPGNLASGGGPLGTAPAISPNSIVFKGTGGTLRYSATNQWDYSGRFSTAANQRSASTWRGKMSRLPRH